jgi:NADH:ubiquinone oxidoreductase subunit H
LSIYIFFGGGYFFFKSLVCCFFFVWVRCCFPRYRYDFLIDSAWKILLPFSLFFLLLSFSLFY